MPVTKTCPIKGKRCILHGYVHGREAEELRSGIEKIVKELPENVCCNHVDDVRDALEQLLNGVDARDSEAYLSAQEGRHGHG